MFTMSFYYLFVCFSVCIARSFDSAGRVVGGINAKPGEFPYIVSVRKNAAHNCGGTILDKFHVLTAAHCAYMRQAHELSVQYGVISISKDGPAINVAKAFVHPEFNSYDLRYDVCVLKLEEAIIFSDIVLPVVLPKQNEVPPANQWGVLAGWGLPYSGGNVMKDLQRVDLIVYLDEDCKAAHGSMVDSIHNLCGGVPEGGKGQCNGDSGGPLVVNGTQYGIVSWSVKPCTVKGYPGVYARVPSYINWINEKIAS